MAQIDTDWRPEDGFTPFVYRAQIDNVVDGDTFDSYVDLGFDTFQHMRVRLFGIDTREISFVSHESEEYKRGMAHYWFTEEWVESAQAHHEGEWPFLLQTAFDVKGSYGRVLAYVYRRDINERLGAALLEEFDDVEVYE